MKRTTISRNSLSEKIIYNLVFLILVCYTICLFYPLLWMLFSSVKNIVDYTLEPFSLPNTWCFSNYIEIFKVLKLQILNGDVLRDVYIGEMFFNSLLYSVGAALAGVFVPCLTAYAVAKYDFKLRNVFYNIAIIIMILPIVGSLPSQLRLMSALHFTDTFIGVWIMGAGGFGMNFLLLYSAFKTVSWSYAEAAFIDGASHFTVFFRIMMPMIKGTFGALFLLGFINVWNDYMTPMLYLPNKPTIAYGIFRFQFDAASMGYSMPYILAGFTVAMLPIIVLFLFFRKTVMTSMTMGGLKG